MNTLRITLDSLRDLGSPTSSGTPGTAQTARIYCQSSLGEGGVLADGLHSIPDEIVDVETLPWTYDLVDPTDATPTGWGWTVKIRPEDSPVMVAPLTAETIAALPQVDGVRVARLEKYVGLSDALATGGFVTAGLAGQAADEAAASATTAASSATEAAASASSAWEAVVTAGAADVTAYPDPTNPDLLILSYPAFLSTDGTSVTLPIGA